MSQQNKRNQNYQTALVTEYEAMSQKGTVGFYEETVFLALIEHYQNKESFSKAIEVVDHAIEQHAYTSTFHKKKAELLLGKGCASQALSCLDQAELFAPSEFETTLLRVESLNMLGYREEALAILNQLEPESDQKELSEIYLSRAVIYESRQQFKKMFLALEQSVLLNPTNVEALERVWFSVEMSRCFEESITLHQKLIDLDPYNYVAWYNLGYSYNALENYAAAADSFEYAFIINKEFEFAYRDCANACIEMKDFQRALDCYKEALEFVKVDSDILLNIGYCFESLNASAKAKTFYLKAAKADPSNDVVYYRLGECYFKEQNWMSAIAAFEKALALEDLKEEYFLALGRCYFNIDDPHTTQSYFRRATEIAPEVNTCWIEYIFFFIKMGNVEEAFDTLKEAQFYSYGIELDYLKVACHFVNNDRPAALELFNKTLAINEIDETLIFTYLPDYKNDTEVLSIIALHKADR